MQHAAIGAQRGGLAGAAAARRARGRGRRSGVSTCRSAIGSISLCRRRTGVQTLRTYVRPISPDVALVYRRGRPTVGESPLVHRTALRACACAVRRHSGVLGHSLQPPPEPALRVP